MVDNAPNRSTFAKGADSPTAFLAYSRSSYLLRAYLTDASQSVLTPRLKVFASRRRDLPSEGDGETERRGDREGKGKREEVRGSDLVKSMQGTNNVIALASLAPINSPRISGRHAFERLKCYRAIVELSSRDGSCVPNIIGAFNVSQ